jgi:hypothetical protein
MKYTIKDNSDEKNINLDIHFDINVILVDRYEKDVLISLTKEENEVIRSWFIEQTQHIRDIYDIKNFTISHKEMLKFSMSFSITLTKTLTFPFLRNLLEEFAEPDIHRINFLEIQNMVVFPFAYVDGVV